MILNDRSRPNSLWYTVICIYIYIYIYTSMWRPPSSRPNVSSRTRDVREREEVGGGQDHLDGGERRQAKREDAWPAKYASLQGVSMLNSGEIYRSATDPT